MKVQKAMVKKSVPSILWICNFLPKKVHFQKNSSYSKIKDKIITKNITGTKLQVLYHPIVEFFILWFLKLLSIYFGNK